VVLKPDAKERSAWYRSRALLEISTITLAYSSIESTYSMSIETTKRKGLAANEAVSSQLWLGTGSIFFYC